MAIVFNVLTELSPPVSDSYERVKLKHLGKNAKVICKEHFKKSKNKQNVTSSVSVSVMDISDIPKMLNVPLKKKVEF